MSQKAEDSDYDFSYLPGQRKIELEDYLLEIKENPEGFTSDEIFDYLQQLGIKLNKPRAMEMVLELTGQDFREKKLAEYVFNGKNLKQVSDNCKARFPEHVVIIESKFYITPTFVVIGEDALKLKDVIDLKISGKSYEKGGFASELLEEHLKHLRSCEIKYCILEKIPDKEDHGFFKRRLRSVFSNDIGEVVSENKIRKTYHADENRIETGCREKRELSQEEKKAKVRETYPNAWTPWMPEDDKELKKLLGEGLNEIEISDRLGRKPSAIRSRIRKKSLETHCQVQVLSPVISPSVTVKSKGYLSGRSTIYRRERALELLRIGSGISDAEFRDGQEEAIKQVIDTGGRLLLVQKTGWGKSFVYFIAIKLLREVGMGPAIIISPLLALMRNQLVAAKKMGVSAETINSDNTDDWLGITERVKGDTVDVLLIAPERLANTKFQAQVMPHISDCVSLLVIDEAHCISDWGHDFRVHYRLIERLSRNLPKNLRLLATTATANQRVMNDLCEILGPDLKVRRGSLVRQSLHLQTIRYDSKPKRMAWICQAMNQVSGHGIIYTLTKRDAKMLAHWLRYKGHEVKSYTGGSETKERPALEDALLKNELKALVATPALGMGFDKPDLSFVFHFQAPGSVVTYYQQVGRAGRALDHAHGVLLAGSEDQRITNKFIREAFPTKNEVRKILLALHESEKGLSIYGLQDRLNFSRKRIEKVLTLLELESPSPLVKVDSVWRLTAAHLDKKFWDRVHRLTALRKEEQGQMQEYVGLEEGHMEFLVDALNGRNEPMTSHKCEPLEIALDEKLVREADQFLNKMEMSIEPRKEWPKGGMPRLRVEGNIPTEEVNQVGKALCLWGEGHLGELVKQGKYRDDYFCDELISACSELVKKWKPDVEWVSGVPSMRRPTLVSSFCQQLAFKLELPYFPALICTEKRPEQKNMQNWVQQARNVDGALAINSSISIPESPVLLLDDMVDSRWTLTVAGWLLQNKAGVKAVYPMVLAQAGAGS